MSETPKIYGLLIAIDEYQDPVPPLGGCVNDIRKVKTYLEEKQKALEPKLLILENEAATKAAIVDGFRKHLRQAKPGDTALVYFSGHGTQEDADPDIWPFESDGKLECLVNYDGIVKTGSEFSYNLIADKELRYLLHEVAQTQAHLITIFDCCHSGKVTRKSIVDEKPVHSRRYVTSRLTKACPKREWEQFIFSDSVSREDLRTKPLSEVIPVGQHVQLGACASDQLAYEYDGGGVFTATLLDLLDSMKGEVSYFELRSRIRYMIKNDFKQTPQVYVQGSQQNQLYGGFLGRSIERDPNQANFIYNKTEGWILDMGAVHGFSPDISTVTVNDDEGGPFQAQVQSVKMSYTRLMIQDPEVMTRLNPQKGYRAVVPGALASPINVYLDTADGAETAGELLSNHLKEFKDRLIVVSSEQEADYVVRIKDRNYTITPPAEPERAIAKPVEGWTEFGAKIVGGYLRSIAKWSFIRDLYNPNVHLFEKSPVKMEIFSVKNDRMSPPLEPKGDEIVLNYRKMENLEWGNAIRIKLTNHHKGRVYCSLIYLSEDFQIYSSLLGEPMIFLDPEETAWAQDGGDLELDLPPYVTAYNWPDSNIWLKLIVSTQEFDPAVFDQQPLPMPTDEATRGIKLATPGKINVSDWTAQLVHIRMPNPEFGEG